MRKSRAFSLTASAVLLAATLFVVLPSPSATVSAETSEPAPSDISIGEPPELVDLPTVPEEPAKSPPASLADAEVMPSPGGTEPQPVAPETTLPEPTQPPAQPPTQPPTNAPAVRKPIYRLPADRREIVLTFDDGPSRQTRTILEILAAEGVPAVFFWVAGLDGVQMAPELLARGHKLGSHSMSHADLSRLNSLGQRAEIADSTAILSAAAQERITYFRPPYGAWNEDTLKLAAESGLSTVMWDVDSRDWALANDPDRIVANVLQEVQEGSIILLHERPQTVQVLPRLIRELRTQGYSFSLLP